MWRCQFISVSIFLIFNLNYIESQSSSFTTLTISVRSFFSLLFEKHSSNLHDLDSTETKFSILHLGILDRQVLSQMQWKLSMLGNILLDHPFSILSDRGLCTDHPFLLIIIFFIIYITSVWIFRNHSWRLFHQSCFCN